MLPGFAADGRLDLGSVRLERRGKAVHVTAANPRFLNAEDDTTLDRMEIAVDVAILDPASEIMVLRGGAVEHPEICAAGRVFGAGINLTHLYRGKIPFVWFLRARPRLRPQALPRRGAARRGARTTSPGAASRSRGSPRSTPSRSAAIASFCSSPTTCSPPTTPS